MIVFGLFWFVPCTYNAFWPQCIHNMVANVAIKRYYWKRNMKPKYTNIKWKTNFSFNLSDSMTISGHNKALIWKSWEFWDVQPYFNSEMFGVVDTNIHKGKTPEFNLFHQYVISLHIYAGLFNRLWLLLY